MTKNDLWTTATVERNWLVFELQPRGNSTKPNKVPVDPASGRSAGRETAASMTFAEARKAAKGHNKRQGVGKNEPGSWGIGYVPRPGSTLVGVDIDNAFASDGTLKPDIAELIEDGETYIERSPSGTGLRVLIERREGDEQRPSNERNEVGIFGDGRRFFTVTGNTLKPKRTITEAPKLRQKVLDRMAGGDAAQGHHLGGPHTPQQPASDPWRGVVPHSERERALRDALTYVKPVDDHEWVKVSAAIHSAGRDLGLDVARSIFDDWCDQIGGDTSQNDKRWNSFDASRPGGATVATIFSEASARGWRQARYVFGSIPGGGGGPVPSLKPFRASDFHGRPVPPREWLVEGKIPIGDVTLLYGDGGTGKSLLALQLACSVATGGDWISLPVTQGPVFCLSAEDDQDELHRRLSNICNASFTGLDALNDLHLLSLAGGDAVLGATDAQGQIHATGVYSQLREQIELVQPTLVVLDTLNDLFSGNENDKGQARQFISLLRRIAFDQRCAVLLLAHPSRSGMLHGTGDSGSVGWSNSARARLYLRRADDAATDERTLSTKKANYGAVGDELTVRYRKGVFVRTGYGKSQGETLQAKARRVFYKLLERRLANGLTTNAYGGNAYAPKVFPVSEDCEGLKKKDFERAMHELLERGCIAIEETGPPSKRVTRLACVSPPGDDEEQAEAAEPELVS